MGTSSVIMYELNEVPWQIVDLFVERHPDSAFATLSRAADTRTTINDDTADLSPWRTWPTLHRSMYTVDHNSYELGQDPATFRGVDLWDVLDGAGVSVGLFGALQSWPARRLRSGGFFVPDTFARDAETYPAELSTFQDFNLRMTSENSFSADAPLSVGRIGAVGLDLLRRGLTVRSMYTLVRHLVRERRDPRHKGARPMMQVVPSFDLFWNLFRTHRPRFSIFFTNHVASMMHRYWGDAVPGYDAEFSYEVDEVYSTFVMSAMQLADQQLAEIMRYVDENEGARLIVAASMGQGPVQHRTDLAQLLYLEDGERLGRFLDCGEAWMRRAMHPMCSLEFADEAMAEQAADRIARIVDGHESPIFEAVEQRGRTVTFQTAYRSIDDSDDRKVTLDDRIAAFEEVGLGVRERLGGDNTAYHVPEGVLFDYEGRRRPPTDRGARSDVRALDVAPSLLKNVFGIDPPESMQGRCRDDLFV